MQTFLPLPDFAASARCLDRPRLNKQRSEILQLLRALLVKGAGWSHHPAAKMWKGHEGSLALYGLQICGEWIGRGFADSCHDKIAETCLVAGIDDPTLPAWLGDEDFHRSHKSNLLRKDPVWYGRFGWDVPHDLPYIWPTTKVVTP